MILKNLKLKVRRGLMLMKLKKYKKLYLKIIYKKIYLIFYELKIQYHMLMIYLKKLKMKLKLL
jgi:hypothetical protein